MTGIYLTAFLIGVTILVLAVFFGHEHDLFHHDAADHDGPGITNLKVIMAFLAAFGAAGLIARHYGSGVGSSIGIAVAGGVGLGAVVLVLLRLIYRQQSNSQVSATAIIGLEGFLMVGIDDHGLGQVSVRLPNGEQQTYLARSQQGERIDAGVYVKIENFAGPVAVVKSREVKAL